MKMTLPGRSVRWKLVMVYVLLVFIAITVIGVFLISQLEGYYTNSIRKNITNTVNEGALTSSFSTYENLESHRDEIGENIKGWGVTLNQEIYVVDDTFEIIASTTETRVKSALEVLDCDAILQALTGEPSESFSSITSGNQKISVLNEVFPLINEEGKALGVLYVRADMSSVEDSVTEAGYIFIRSMILALVITVVLGFLIAKSITEPIKDVTAKAEQMSEGDFSQEVVIKSDDEIGQLAGMFNILRIRLNDALSRIESEKNKLEAVLRHMADALIAVDLEGNIIHVNQAAMSLLGISEAFFNDAGELPSYDTLISGINKDLCLEKIKKNCEEGAVDDVFEYGGRAFAVRYDKYKDENGGDIGILMIIQDISERQKLEKMQMDFVANVSHELKTPLTTIKSYTETMLDQNVDDPEIQKQFLGIIDTEADRMARLVKELLQLSRMENNQENWSMKEINLALLVKTAVQKMELTAGSKSQQMNVLFHKDDNLPVVADRDKMEQVILNILSNAIKYTPDGGRIDVDAFRKGNTVKVIISDSGIGIPEEEISRVFERFFRVDKARSRAMGGTGLGLSITKQIVEEHGGEIGIESKEGQGTRVTVSLPVAPSALRGVPLED